MHELLTPLPCLILQPLPQELGTILRWTNLPTSSIQFAFLETVTLSLSFERTLNSAFLHTVIACGMVINRRMYTPIF